MSFLTHSTSATELRQIPATLTSNGEEALHIALLVDQKADPNSIVLHHLHKSHSTGRLRVIPPHLQHKLGCENCMGHARRGRKLLALQVPESIPHGIKRVPNAADKKLVEIEPLGVSGALWDRRRRIPLRGKDPDAPPPRMTTGGIHIFEGESTRTFSHKELILPRKADLDKTFAAGAPLPTHLHLCSEWEKKIVSTQGRQLPRGPSIHECLKLDKFTGGPGGKGTGDFCYKLWAKGNMNKTQIPKHLAALPQSKAPFQNAVEAG